MYNFSKHETKIKTAENIRTYRQITSQDNSKVTIRWHGKEILYFFFFYDIHTGVGSLHSSVPLCPDVIPLGVEMTGLEEPRRRADMNTHGEPGRVFA